VAWDCNQHGEFKAEALNQGLIDSQNRVHCPECGQIMTDQGDEDKNEIPEVKGASGVSDEAPRTNAKRSVEFAAEDLHLMKKMVENGLGESLNDIAQQALRFYGGVRFNETMLGGDTNTMNEKVLEKLSEGNTEGMFEKAMAISMLNGTMGESQQNQQNQGSDDMMSKMMEYKMQQELVKSFGSDEENNQGGDELSMDKIMKMKMMEGMTSGSDSSMDETLIRALRDDDDSGMDMGTLMMMMNNDGDDAYKELLQRFESQREQQTELEQNLIEERFASQLNDLKGAMRSIKEEVDEAKNDDDLDTALDRLEKMQKQAEKLGLSNGSDDGNDEARTAQKLIDSFGENFGGVLEKYMENQAGAGGIMGGGQQPNGQAATANGGAGPANPNKIQQAQQSAEADVSGANPTPDDINPSF